MEQTPSQTIGPFFSFGLCTRTQNLLVREGAEGALVISGVVVDGEGAPVPDAVVEVWDEAARRFGRCGTDAGGGYRFVTSKPPPVPSAAGPQAPHLVVLVFARGLLKPVLT